MRLEHLLSGAVTLTLPTPQVIPGGKRKRTRIKEDKDRRRFVRHPSGFLYYGHLFSMYIEIFDILTHETVE